MPGEPAAGNFIPLLNTAAFYELTMRDEQEISDMRDDAATAVKKAKDCATEAYWQGVRDGLEWVVGDLPTDELKDSMPSAEP